MSPLFGANILNAWDEVTSLNALPLVKSPGGSFVDFGWLCGTDAATQQSYANQLLTAKQKCDQLGLKFLLAATGIDEWDPNFSSAFSSNKGAACLAIINNALTPTASYKPSNQGWGDFWINAWKTFIQTLQPWGINILDEVFVNNNQTDTQYLAAWSAFAVRMIDALRTIKPDLVCLVHGMPYQDNTGIANTPIPRSNLIYLLHSYYLSDGATAASWEPFAQSYYNGNLALAKTQMTDWLVNSGTTSFGNGAFAMFKAKGLPVLIEELGTFGQDVHNNFQFIRDSYSIAHDYGVGISQFCLAPFGTDPTKNVAEWGLLLDDGTWSNLNSSGQLWSQMIQQYATTLPTTIDLSFSKPYQPGNPVTLTLQ
jgi:hypothetical protein